MTIENSASDGDLLQQARNGHPEAFAELVDRHKDALVGYLIRMSGNRDHAEDTAQEAFLRLYEKGDNYQERGLLRSYLFRIATNLVHSQNRRQATWHRLRALFQPVDTTETAAVQEQALLRHEARDEIQRAISNLPMKFRAPIVLREIDGWPYREIGEALGCSEGTIKSRIHRGRQMLRKSLSPYWEGRTS